MNIEVHDALYDHEGDDTKMCKERRTNAQLLEFSR